MKLLSTHIKSLPLVTLFSLFHCGPPMSMADAASPTDASPSDGPTGDAALATRPPVFPTSPPVRCTQRAFHRLTVPAPMRDCLPWVGFLQAHSLRPELQMVGASACGQALVIDPTMPTQRLPINLVPDGRMVSAGGMTPIGGVFRYNTLLSLGMYAQFGNGLESVIWDLTLNPPTVQTFAADRAFRITEPGAQIVGTADGEVVEISAVRSSMFVAEIPRMQPDGTFLVERRMRTNGAFGMSYRADLTSVRRRIGTPQREGVTTDIVEGVGRSVVTCVVADGKILVDFQRDTTVLTPVQFDTGDPSLQQCSLANINGTLVGIASSDTRSVAFTVELEVLANRPPSVIRLLPLQPYFLPPEMSQINQDEGPFGVALFGGVDPLPSGLGIYTRRPMGSAVARPVFALFDRALDYDSLPTAPTFASPDFTTSDRYTAAVWPNGQVAFARYDPTTGILDATTASCIR